MQCPCDVRYLKLFVNAPGKVCLPVTIVREQEEFFTVSPISSSTPQNEITYAMGIEMSSHRNTPAEGRFVD